MTEDKLSAYQTLFTCLETVSRLMAPFAPFYSDVLYEDLMRVANEGGNCNVHLADYPVSDASLIDKDLELRMSLAQKITSMVLSLRKKEQVIVRQPLQCIMIPAQSEQQKAHIEKMADLIKSEVNVKEIRFVDSIQLEKTVKCNFRVLGKKFGKLMGSINKVVTSLTQEQISELEINERLPLNIDGQEIEILKEDVEIFSQDIPGWSVVNDGTLTVALDLEITENLRQEGIAREVVKRIQAYRKDNDFKITDHIHVVMEECAEVKASVESFKDYICSQVLCDKWEWGTSGNTEFVFDEYKLKVTIQKL